MERRSYLRRYLVYTWKSISDSHCSTLCFRFRDQKNNSEESGEFSWNKILFERKRFIGLKYEWKFFSHVSIQLQVMGDDLSISPTSASPRRQVRQISKIVPHPYYNPKTLANDIAIIFVCIFHWCVIALSLHIHSDRYDRFNLVDVTIR